jgi:chemotaxis protein methyltransferase CheR
MHSDLVRVSGLPLESFRRDHVDQQVERACRREQVSGEDALVRALRRDVVARRRFRRSVAISHGAMFRDPEQFKLLEEVLLPRLLAGGSRLSAWSAGCSDGAELHTLGLVLSRMGVLDRTVLLGSDLLAENLALARRVTIPPTCARDCAGSAVTSPRTDRLRGAGGSCFAATSRSI